MRTLTIFLAIFLLIGCTPKRFLIYTDADAPLEITFNGNYQGDLSRGDSLIIKTSQSSPINIAGTNDNTYAKISYGSAPKGEETSLIVSHSSGNVEEISRGMKYTGSGMVEEYRIGIGDYAESTGYLKLTSNEENVEIYLDYNKLGTIYDESFNKKVPTGPHILMARKDFFSPITIHLDIKKNEVYPIDFILREVEGWKEKAGMIASVTQARGNLTVGTEKSDFSVEIEGVSKEAPFELKDMPAGVYELRITCNDFTKYMEVTIPVDTTTFIDLDALYPR